MDPLYHQTSAQFDEGGAKGLLLNNLGVFGKCAVLFDSLEVPGKCVPCDLQQDKTIDLSFTQGVLVICLFHCWKTFFFHVCVFFGVTCGLWILCRIC